MMKPAMPDEVTARSSLADTLSGMVLRAGEGNT